MFSEGVRPEPALLTHREPADEQLGLYEEGYDDEDDYDEDDDGPLTDGERKAARRKKVWRRVRRTFYVGTALAIIVPILAFFITYQLVEVENPEEVAKRQGKVVTFVYADGTSEMTKVAEDGGNRIMLTYEQIPKQVLHAVYAAEDQSFETNAGFDLTGILRAVWNQATGKEGGGSTITQQYIKMASGDDDPTLTRKWVEVVKAYKMNETYDKPQIITAYLNTIYFGRGAYGVAAAAKAYYGITDLNQITKSQAALLAGMIQSPARSKDVNYQQQRWNYVAGRMISNQWMTEAEKGEFPAPAPLDQTKTSLPPPRRGLTALAFEELETRGISEQRIKQNGYRIVMTIDQRAQELAEAAVAKEMEGQPENLHPALVAVEPKTGAIRAYYPGKDGAGLDWAAAVQEPGSSFKPFDLVGLLRMGKGLGEVYDTTPKSFGGSKEVRNASTPRCGSQCTVEEAMKESLNVVFSDMVYNDVKPDGVAAAAQAAGVRTSLDKAKGDINIAIGGGATQVTTVDMASAYATFAAGGDYRMPHLVQQVVDTSGEVIYDANVYPDHQPKLAFDEDQATNQKIARNVTEALLEVPGYAKIACKGGRQCAGKTGTHQYTNPQGVETKDNAKAWMVGYTPQLSTAVSLSGDATKAILRDKDDDIIYGSGLPGRIWKGFMDSYHEVMPKEGFGKFVAIGKVEAKAPPSTSRKPAPSESSVKPTEVSPPPSEPTKPTKSTEPSEPSTTSEPSRTRPGRPTETTDPGLPLPGR